MSFDPRPALAGRIYYGWVIAVACFLASVAVFGTSYAFGVFYDAFIEEFGASRSLLALVFGLQTALLYVAAVGAGRVIERRGQRSVAAVSSAIFVSGLVWTALADSYFELLVAFGAVTAVGMAGLYIVGYATLPAWFERRRGAASGFASAGLGVGLVVVPPGADAAISALGWRAAMLVVAGSVGLLLSVVAILLADDPADVGADLGVEFDGFDASAPDGGGNGDASGSSDAGDGDADASIRAIVTAGPFLLVLLGWMLIFAPLYVVLSHVVLHAADAGLGRSTGVLAIAVIGAATTVARIGIGLLSDRLGRVRTFVACGVLLGGSTIGVAIAPATGPFLAIVAVFGAGYGGCGGLLGAITADLFGNRSLNTLFAILSLSFAVSGLLAPPLAGLWFEFAGSYRAAFVGAGVVGVVGAGCVMLGASTRNGE